MWKRIKIFFLLITGVCFCFSMGTAYFQYKAKKEKVEIQLAADQKNYEFILKKYKNVKPSSKKTDEIHLSRLFFKALALEQTQQSDQAKPFWEILKTSSSPKFRSAALFYLGLHFWEENNFSEAKKYLSSPALNKPGCEWYIRSQYYLGSILLHESELDQAIELLRPIIKTGGENDFLDEIKKLAGEINIKRIFTRRITSNSVDYRIVPGDMLATIANKFNTTVELIMKNNNLSSAVIRPNNHLKVVTSEFSIYVSKEKNNLIVYENGLFFKEYAVGTGKDNVTPVGVFEVTGKQANPTWYRHDGKVIPFGTQENLLGTRWMSINYPGYGIHGTWDEGTIGKQSSAGCIRLKNSDVEELFIYIPLGAKVTIEDN